MNGLLRRRRCHLGHVSRHALFIAGCSSGEVGSDGAIVLQLGEDALGPRVEVRVHVVVLVPEEEEVLLDDTVGRWTLDLGRVPEASALEELEAPVHQEPEVVDPLPEARKLRHGAVDGIRRLGTVEHARVVRSHAHPKVHEAVLALIPLGDGDGQDGRRLQTLEDVVLEDGIAGQLGKPHGVGDLGALVQLGDDDPRVVEDRMRDDVGVDGIQLSEIDHEVLPIARRRREDLMVCFLDAVQGVLVGERSGMSSNAGRRPAGVAEHEQQGEDQEREYEIADVGILQHGEDITIIRQSSGTPWSIYVYLYRTDDTEVVVMVEEMEYEDEDVVYSSIACALAPEIEFFLMICHMDRLAPDLGCFHVRHGRTCVNRWDSVHHHMLQNCIGSPGGLIATSAGQCAWQTMFHGRRIT